MPLYEYRCHNCEQRVTLLAKNYSDPDPLRCPECGGETLTRVISRVAVNTLDSNPLQNLSKIDKDVKQRLDKKLRGDSLLG